MMLSSFSISCNLTYPVLFTASSARLIPSCVASSLIISSLDDLTALAQLRVPNIRGVIVGRALYEGRFSVAEAITTLENASR